MHTLNLCTLTKDNSNIFFSHISIGTFFQYSETDFLWEDIQEIALDQGKKVQKISSDSSLYSILGAYIGFVLYDIKEETTNIQNEEISRLRTESNKCYHRIEELETQLGIRGVERLERCEFCKKFIYPYQSKTLTSSDGIAHTECDILNEIKTLEQVIIKKEELVTYWTNEANKIGNENHSLTVDNRILKEDVSAKELKILELTEINKKFEDLYKNYDIKIHDLETSLSEFSLNSNTINFLNKEYMETIITAYNLFKRVKRLLGVEEDSIFYPIPQINVSGEYREIFKSSFTPIYYDVKNIIEHISKTIDKG